MTDALIPIEQREVDFYGDVMTAGETKRCHNGSEPQGVVITTTPSKENQ